ncbi:MAG: superoxide dismutase [Armatimonadetes bacterium]|nr:superoxide dismutase [Armatimonadota bacterium]
MSDSLSRREALTALGAGALALGLHATGAGAADNPHAGLMAFKDGQYVLPPLPYDYKALEPHIDEQTMRLHHDKHHAAYVAGLNKALAALEAARKANDFAAIQALSGQVAFHGSGHFLHTLFWNNMRAPGGAGPSAALTAALSRDFGSLDGFKGQFGAASKAVEGSGWGILAYEMLGKKLLVLQAEKHQNLTAQGVVPVLVLDVWEHAYYLKYQNNRGEYVNQWWNVVNWDGVERHLAGMGALV